MRAILDERRHDRRRHGASHRLRAARPGRECSTARGRTRFVGGSHEFLRDGARLLDARTQFHYLATVITPAMAHAQVGAGSAYAYTVHDANGELLDGAKTYRLHVDPDPPAKNFWAVDVYDTQTRSLLQVDIDALPRARQQLRDPPSQRRRLLRPLLRPEAPDGHGVQLGRDHPRASRGSRSSGSTARWSRGSTRPGSSTSSSRSAEIRRPTGLSPERARGGQRPDDQTSRKIRISIQIG